MSTFDAPGPVPTGDGGQVPAGSSGPGAVGGGAGGPATTRVRLRFTKLGKVRWTSHRDVARMWERAFRRVGLPLAYSAGFSPRPKVSFGLALPTGHESVAEYLDLELLPAADAGDPIADLDGLAGRLSAALPAGLGVTGAVVIAPRTASLQEDVASCTWQWAAVPALPPLEDGVAPPAGDPPRREALAAAVDRLLAAPELVVTRVRKGREITEDIRPQVLDVRLLAGDPGRPPEPGDDGTDHLWLEADLATQPRSIRPLEVLRALDPALDEHRVRRLNQWILRDGARLEPLETGGPAAATDAPHALGRAS